MFVGGGDGGVCGWGVDIIGMCGRVHAITEAYD